ncbi:MAG: DMT family transporter [Clostridia bacterium]|nr:DMT family transporter [Clostridia bacterium]
MNPSYLLVILGVVMVSYSGPLVKLGLQYDANPATIAMMRMALTALILLPLLFVKRKGQAAPVQSLLKMTRGQWLWSVAASVCLALHYLTWMTSLDQTDTFASVALVCTQPLFVAALSGLVLKERMPRAAIPGAAVAVIGALLIALNALLGGVSGDLTGALLALAGAIMMAGHWLCNRYARRTVEALPFMVLLYAQTALLLALTLPFLGGFRMTWMALLAVAGLAVGCTLLGHSMFTLALGKVSATVVSFAILGEPVGAMVWSFIMFGEKPPLLVFIGGVVTIAGLALYLMGTSGLLRRRSGNA